MKLLLTGATGVAGLAIYRAALNDPSITHILLLQRRSMPSWASLPPNADTKTTVIVHSDFLSYPPDVAKRIAEADACIWALGRSSMGMKEEEYTKLTQGYVLTALKALREGRAGEREEKPFRFVYLSGEGADQTQKSSQMWARVKGKTETDILTFAKDSPNMNAQIYRPGYFFPSDKYPEDRKNQRSRSAGWLDAAMTPVLSRFTPSLLSPIDDLARFAVELAKGRWPNQEVLMNEDMRKLVKQL